MKLSKFNTNVPYKEKHIYHNSLTENFLLLDPLLMDLVNAAEIEKNIKGIDDIHPEFYKALVEQGFVVPKKDDEILKVRELIKKVDVNDEAYSLMILPTMNCNFKCWYCYESHIKGSKTSEANIEKIKLHIKNKFSTMKDLKEFGLSFFGGEPLLYFKDVILPILKYTYDMAKQKKVILITTFTSNGFLINDEMVKNLVKYETNNFQITFDGYGKDHDDVRYVSKSKGSYNTIVSNIKRLVRNEIFVVIRINYTQKNIDGVTQILKDFEDLTLEERKRITLDMQKVWQEDNLEGLFEKADAFLLASRDFGFNRLPASSINTVKGSCYADKKNQAAINYNGDVYKCNARDFTQENKEGVLNDDGEIEWGERLNERMNIKLSNKPCLDCSILPICGGGCSQYALEHKDEDYCIHDFDEAKKRETVLDMFLLSELPDA